MTHFDILLALLSNTKVAQGAYLTNWYKLILSAWVWQLKRDLKRAGNNPLCLEVNQNYPVDIAFLKTEIDIRVKNIRDLNSK